MILGETVVQAPMVRIPRESGDDPRFRGTRDTSGWYSPRERG